MKYLALLGSLASLGSLAWLGACNGTETPVGTGGAPSAGGTTSSGGGTTPIAGTAAGGSPATGGAATGGAPSTGCGSTTLPTACNTSSTPACTLNVNGTTRQFYVVLPTNYSATTPYPLVFVWHGRGGTATSFLPTGTYNAGFYGVRTAFPNAIYVTSQGLDSGTSDSGTDYGWPNTNGQDVNFTKAMITWLEQNYCIDTNRIFSTGMSYGGIMSNTLACQMPDVFRAIGVMSGSLFTYGQPSCTNLPIAAWFTHGDADTVVQISGDVTARDLFISHNGCSTTNTTTVTLTDSRATTDAGTPVATVCTIYNQCTAGIYPVVWCPVPG
jgi:polyhydroxybutyrate depolymerase